MPNKEIEHVLVGIDGSAATAPRWASVEVVAKRGLHAADGLIATATEHSADLLIVGARGVAMKLLHGVSMSILVPPTHGA